MNENPDKKTTDAASRMVQESKTLGRTMDLFNRK
jgi:hypothetical protein